MSEIQNVDSKTNLNLNGSLIEGKFIPDELLIEIFFSVHYKSLLACHLVCKKWNLLVKDYVWKKKAESISKQVFPEDLTWVSLYCICDKNPFDRNFLLSSNAHVESEGTFKTITFNVNSPTINVLPLPEELISDGQVTCIIFSKSTQFPYHSKRKIVVDLLKEGFSEYLLDNLQPAIEVSEWYCCNWEEEKAEYKCSMKLVACEDSENQRLMRVHHIHKKLKDVSQRGQWLKITHIFKNYGKGLRKIKFYDGGEYNIVVAGACVKAFVPRASKKIE